MTTRTSSAVTAYAERVLNGDVLTGKLVRLACERHMRDMEHGHERGLYFDEKAARDAIKFFSLLKLPDGNNAGKPFILTPWEEFVIGSVDGWRRVSDNKRRFQYAYIEVARANGKTPLGAGVLLKGLTADYEAGAQCYSAATTRDQAKIAFRDAITLAESNETLRSKTESLVNNLTFKPLNSFLRPLSSDASKMDGLRVHIALADELHEHPNGDVLAKLRTGMKSSQPLLFMITTAGYDRNTVCWAEHDYTVKVLEGLAEDDARFGFIATLDDKDDWRDESVWVKANPNLGVTVRLDTLRQECESAKQMPTQENDFKRLRMNIWTEGSVRWLPMDAYDECGERFDPDILLGKRCYGGLDLSTTGDLSAFSLLFPPQDGVDHWYTLLWCWLPEFGLRERSIRERLPYDVWVREEYVTLCEGNIIDQRDIKRAIQEAGLKYWVKEVGYDPWHATQVAAELESEGATVVPIPQGFARMHEPSERLERLIVARQFRHNANPVLRAHAANCVAKYDVAGNMRPDKGEARQASTHIDGMVATIIAMAAAIRNEAEAESIYEERGPIII